MSRREAFTLIEVMVAVMIVSVVIAAMIELTGNSSLLLENVRKKSQNLQYLSLLRESRYGFEDDKANAARLLERFDLDDDLRRALKAIPLHMDYKEKERLDLSKFDFNASDVMEETTDQTQQQSQSNLVLEIGQSGIKQGDVHISVTRIRVQ
jgi:prepilin-type N-terminal cleavage/methylation domain-containing protein